MEYARIKTAQAVEQAQAIPEIQSILAASTAMKAAWI